MSFEANGTTSYGLLCDGGILDIPASAAAKSCEFPATLNELIDDGAAGLGLAQRLLDANDGELMPLEGVGLIAPIPRPRKNIFCVGRNYSDHVAEGYRSRGEAVALPEFPQFFSKAPTTVMGPDAQFVHDPNVTQKLDYEVELGVVIGRGGRDIPASDALDHIFGVTLINDLTARDLQRRHDQWFKGKSLDGSAPMGPCIVTLDEIDDLGALQLTARVNGSVRQQARVAQMIFTIPEIIAQLSAGLTLEPGDIIATGTPSGVGYAMDPPQFLVAGDVVECEIDQIGSIVTRIVSAGSRP